MDGDSFTYDDRAIINHTDIDVFRSDDDFVVEEETPSDARSLEGLPSELIGMIADYLDGENLSILQALGSRTILQAIDHALVSTSPPLLAQSSGFLWLVLYFTPRCSLTIR